MPEERTGEIRKTAGGTVMTGTGIELAQMVIVRAALRREQAGIKRGSGRSIKSMWAEHFGLNKRASYDAVITKIEDRIKELEPTINRNSGFPEPKGDPEIPEPRDLPTK